MKAASSTTVALVFGATAPSLVRQLKAREPHQIKMMKLFQRDADAITRLSVRGLLTERETDKARRRLISRLREEMSRGVPV